MTKLYKLTDAVGCTQGPTQWGENVTREAAEGEPVLCSPTVLHAYTHPLLAVLLNPTHAQIKNPRLWEAQGEVVATDRGLKVGCKRLTTVREIPLPAITTEQRVRFAILCARKVCTDAAFVLWSDRWLSGEDRTADAADAAYAVAADATYAAALAARAAYAAAYATYATYAASAASAANAAYAAEAAARADAAINLEAIAEEACKGAV